MESDYAILDIFWSGSNGENIVYSAVSEFVDFVLVVRYIETIAYLYFVNSIWLIPQNLGLLNWKGNFSGGKGVSNLTTINIDQFVWKNIILIIVIVVYQICKIWTSLFMSVINPNKILTLYIFSTDHKMTTIITLLQHNLIHSLLFLSKIQVFITSIDRCLSPASKYLYHCWLLIGVQLKYSLFQHDCVGGWGQMN